MRHNTSIGLIAVLALSCNRSEQLAKQPIVPFSESFYNQFKESSTRKIPGRQYQVKKGETITSILQREARKNPCFKSSESYKKDNTYPVELIFFSTPKTAHIIPIQEALDSANKQYLETLAARPDTNDSHNNSYNNKWSKMQKGDKIIIPDFEFRQKNTIGSFTFFGGEYKNTTTKYELCTYTTLDNPAPFNQIKIK